MRVRDRLRRKGLRGCSERPPEMRERLQEMRGWECAKASGDARTPPGTRGWDPSVSAEDDETGRGVGMGE